MCSSQIHLESTLLFPPSGLAPEESNWYAIHTRPRHEKWIAQQLQEKRVFTFLPLLQQIHQRSGRRSKVEVPLFNCYAFVRIARATDQNAAAPKEPWGQVLSSWAELSASCDDALEGVGCAGISRGGDLAAIQEANSTRA